MDNTKKVSDILDIRQYVFDFVAGKIHPKNFLEELNQNPKIYDWMQSIVPAGLTCYEIRLIPDRFGEKVPVSIEIPYDIRVVIKQHLKESYDRWGTYLNVHFDVAELLQKAFPNEIIEVSDKIKKRFNFGLDTVPEYLEGKEVADIIDDVIDSIPQNLSKTARIKLCKAKLRECFHVEGNHFPRWIQGAEWPMGSDNLPMRFVGQKRKKGKAYETMLYTEFLFEDVKTGEQRIIEQFT